MVPLNNIFSLCCPLVSLLAPLLSSFLQIGMWLYFSPCTRHIRRYNWFVHLVKDIYTWVDCFSGSTQPSVDKVHRQTLQAAPPEWFTPLAIWYHKHAKYRDIPEKTWQKNVGVHYWCPFKAFLSRYLTNPHPTNSCIHFLFATILEPNAFAPLVSQFHESTQLDLTDRVGIPLFRSPY